MDHTYENIRYSVNNGIALLQLHRPEAMNALNSAINAEILSALDAVEADRDIRVLILTGSECAFAAGADVKEMAGATPRYARDFCSQAIRINDRLEALPIPVIAAVGGLAFGGGCEMVLSCDFRIGGPHTLLSFPEVSLGIIPGANGCARAVSILGPARAKQMILLTEKIAGRKAYEMGLLNWFVEGEPSEDVSPAAAEYDAILRKAAEIAEKLAKKPGCAVAAAKAAVNRTAAETVAAGKRAETAEFALLFDTHDQKEGMAAMLERRHAVFTNR